MDNSTLPSAKVSGQEVRFSSVDGEVVGVDRQTDTQFQTTSGSVVAFGTVVNVTAPTVTAYSQASKLVWIRRDDGTEMSVVAPDSFEGRAGHRVTVLLASGGQHGTDVHQWCAVVNHTTRLWNQVDQLLPVRIYGWWTAFWNVFITTAGSAGFTFGVVVLWAALFSAAVGSSSQVSMPMFMACGVVAFFVVMGSVSAGVDQVKRAKADYTRAVKRVVETICSQRVRKRLWSKQRHASFSPPHISS